MTLVCELYYPVRYVCDRDMQSVVSVCIIVIKTFKEMNSYLGKTMVKKNKDKMIISVNKAYFLQLSA